MNKDLKHRRKAWNLFLERKKRGFFYEFSIEMHETPPLSPEKIPRFSVLYNWACWDPILEGFAQFYLSTSGAKILNSWEKFGFPVNSPEESMEPLHYFPRKSTMFFLHCKIISSLQEVGTYLFIFRQWNDFSLSIYHSFLFLSSAYKYLCYLLP